MNKIATILWLTFCEVDERYIDLFRVGYAIVLLAGVGLSIYSVASGGAFDPISFGTGLGAILFGGGAGIGIRARLEDGVSSEYEANKSPEYRTYSPFNKNRPEVDDDNPWVNPYHMSNQGSWTGYPGPGAGTSNPWFNEEQASQDDDDLPASRNTE